MFKMFLRNNNLIELTEFDLKALCNLKGFEPKDLKVLYLGSNLLTNIDFITDNTPFINLEILYLEDNKIQEIKKSLSKLKKLKILNLDFNEINKINLDVPFNDLEKLSIVRSYIINIIDYINYFKNIKILNISRNNINININNLNQIKDLNYLEELNIEHCYLEGNENKMFEILKSMSNLKILRCSNTFKKYNLKTFKT